MLVLNAGPQDLVALALRLAPRCPVPQKSWCCPCWRVALRTRLFSYFFCPKLISWSIENNIEIVLSLFPRRLSRL